MIHRTKGQVAIGSIATALGIFGAIYTALHYVEIEPLKAQNMSIETTITTNRTDFNNYVASTNLILGQVKEMKDQLDFLARRFGYTEGKNQSNVNGN